MTALVLGPILRRGGPDGFGVWVEVSEPCSVAVTTRAAGPSGGASTTTERRFEASTFCIGGHHYAIVEVTPDEPGATIGYDVALNDEPVWPDPALEIPDAVVTGWKPGEPYRISGGSCRQQAPQDRRRRGRRKKNSPVSKALGADALAALAAEIQRGGREAPHLLVLSGDQVYADERHEVMTAALEERRGGPPPEGRPQITSFEEYTWLYQNTWAHPLVRWLLASVPSVMIFDDHDVIDDWNISDTWARDIADQPWWSDRLDSALMSYWVYQHLGNLSAEQRQTDDLLTEIRSVPDGRDALYEFASRVGTGRGRFDTSWSYRLQAGPIQVIVLDARNGRVLDPVDRSMLSPRDWNFLDNALAEDPQVLIVSSVPWLLPPGVHHLEQWVSELVTGRWGKRMSRLAESIRRSIDLEHWAAFGDSVERMRVVLGDRVAADPTYPPIVFSGDVHFAYLAEVPIASKRFAFQLVSSPMRQGDANYEQVARWAAMTSTFDTALRRFLGRGFRRKQPRCAHRVIEGIWTDNNMASLTYENDVVRVRLDAAELTETGLFLRPLLSRELRSNGSLIEPVSDPEPMSTREV